MPGPVPILGAIGAHQADLIASKVEDHLMVEHPRSAQHCYRVRTVIHECQAKPIALAFPVQVTTRLPLRDDAVPEMNIDSGEVHEVGVGANQAPAAGAKARPALARRFAVHLDRRLEVPVRLGPHVSVRSPAVDHGCSEVRDGSAVDLHRHQWHAIPYAHQRDVLDFLPVVGRVVPPHGHAASPLRKANGKDFALDVSAVIEELLQQGPCTLYAEDTVGLLCVEKLVLILVASQPRVDWWVMLYGISQADVVSEPIAGNCGAFLVALVVRAVARGTRTAASSSARHPGGGGAHREVEGRVDVVAAMRATSARKRRESTAGV
mmetsp:Transcript_87055/g.244138  ORF Transcript_87055/g.244138 Transcript_87055/m.244138 type:complete len:321 (+) Transcript_87055:709-1671(+)